MKKKKINIELKELFMAQADKFRCFYGTIKRETDALGNPVVYGKIKVNDGYVYAKAENQDELGSKLDLLVILVLDFDIYKSQGVTTSIWGELINLN